VPAHLDLADRFFRAIQDGDIATVREFYAPHAEIWHNNDNVVQTREENLLTLGWVVHNLKDLRYEDVVRSETATGFVQEHVLRAVANTTPVEMPACIVVTIIDGRITRLNEYLDSAGIDRLANAFR